MDTQKNKQMTKESILDPHLKYAWECDEASPVIPYSAAEKAMDEWAGYLISNSQSVSATYQVPKHILDEYAKQQAIAFVRHCLEHNHLNTDESGSIQLDYNYWHEPHFAYVAGELYSKFIEQKTENK
jgi:hypothetical protein